MPILTSLRSAFKGGVPDRAPLPRTFPAPWGTPYDSGGTRRPFAYRDTVQRAYCDNPVAQRAVRLVSESIGGAPLADADRAALALVQASAGGQSLIETLTAQLLLHGNAFVQIARNLTGDAAGAPAALHALRPERVTIVQGADGWPAAYRYRLGERTHEWPVEDADGWPTIIHFKSFHPADDHYGAGCLAAAEQAVAIHNAASVWNRALLENAARPSGALVYDSDADTSALTDEQFTRLRAQLEDAYQGSGNAGRPMLLEGGLKWQSLALSPADMDFAALKAAAARDIALAFGVPPMLLGLPGDNTYANYREANRALWRLTLLPMAQSVLGTLSQSLAPWFTGLELRLDLDRIPALSEDRERLWKQVSSADFLDDDEKRALLGLPPKGEPGHAGAGDTQ